MSEKLTINSDRTLEEAIGTLRRMYAAARYVRVTALAGRDRTLDQNRMFFELYTHIGEQLYGGDVEHARAEVKLDYGLPILRRDDEELGALCARTLDFLARDKQLEFIRHMSVTSDMTRGQARECIDRVMDAYAEQGVAWPEYLLEVKRGWRKRAA